MTVLFRLGAPRVVLQAACGSKDSRPTPPASKPPAQQSSFYTETFNKRPTVPEITRLGRSLFFDRSLSASGQLACSTCHDPNYAYGPPPKAVATARAIPSLRYLQTVPPFAEHHFDEAVDESVDQGPTGGHMWDGRADALHDQARLPLLNPQEMANSSPGEIVAKVRTGAHAACVKSPFGDDVFDQDEKAFKAVLMALEVFQQSPREFYPYDSKYDGWLRRQTQLSPAEVRGLKWFNDPHGGNCASCHPSQIRNDGAFPQFTDFGLIALGVPRNSTLPANEDPAYFDLGLCGCFFFFF